MTKLDRELAIPDNVAYAASVVARVRAHAPAVSGPLVYVGFSHGASMALRAAAHSGHACAAVIALGGDMPPDVADDAAPLPPALVARGLRDEWFTREKMDRDLERARARGARVQSLEFDGGHEWGAEFLVTAGRFLHSVLEMAGPTALA